MPSPLEIINLALRRVGVRPILSLTDGSEACAVANDTFPVVRDSLLRNHTWKFAKKQATLAQYGVAPTYDYVYAFLLPDDCLFVVSMKDQGIYNILNINGIKVLVSNDANAQITYRSQVTNTGLWDANFTASFVLKLAAEFALSLVKNYPLFEKWELAFQTSIEDAMSNDSIEQSEMRIISPTDLASVRHYAYSGKKVNQF